MTDFVSRISASGGDYTTVALWNTAIRSDLTASSSQVFGVSSVSNSGPADGQAVTGATSGATGTMKHVAVNGNSCYITGVTGTFQSGEQIRQNSNTTKYVVISDSGSQIGNAVLEGGDEQFNISGEHSIPSTSWVTSSTHRVIVRAAEGAQHTGTYGSGFRLAMTNPGSSHGCLAIGVNYFSVIGVGIYPGSGSGGIRVLNTVSTTDSDEYVRDVFIHGGTYAVIHNVWPNTTLWQNCIHNNSVANGFMGNGSDRNKFRVYNCVFYGNPGSGRQPFRYCDARNCAAFNASEGASGFWNFLNLGSNSVTTTLISSDNSPEIDASGRAKVATDQWIGTPGGTDCDYHVKEGADLIGYGLPIDGLTVDADGVARDPSTPTVGPYEFFVESINGLVAGNVDVSSSIDNPTIGQIFDITSSNISSSSNIETPNLTLVIPTYAVVSWVELFGIVDNFVQLDPVGYDLNSITFDDLYLNQIHLMSFTGLNLNSVSLDNVEFNQLHSLSIENQIVLDNIEISNLILTQDHELTFDVLDVNTFQIESTSINQTQNLSFSEFVFEPFSINSLNYNIVNNFTVDFGIFDSFTIEDVSFNQIQNISLEEIIFDAFDIGTPSTKESDTLSFSGLTLNSFYVDDIDIQQKHVLLLNNTNSYPLELEEFSISQIHSLNFGDVYFESLIVSDFGVDQIQKLSLSGLQFEFDSLKTITINQSHEIFLSDLNIHQIILDVPSYESEIHFNINGMLLNKLQIDELQFYQNYSISFDSLTMSGMVFDDIDLIQNVDIDFLDLNINSFEFTSSNINQNHHLNIDEFTIQNPVYEQIDLKIIDNVNCNDLDITFLCDDIIVKQQHKLNEVNMTIPIQLDSFNIIQSHKLTINYQLNGVIIPDFVVKQKQQLSFNKLDLKAFELSEMEILKPLIMDNLEMTTFIVDAADINYEINFGIKSLIFGDQTSGFSKTKKTLYYDSL